MKSSLLSLLLFSCVSLISAQAQFSVNGPETLCTGTSATLTATGCGGTLKWSTDATSASITVSPTVTTTYFVTCTVGTDKSVASISPIVVPNITISSSSGNCFSGSATLTANGLPNGGTLRWKKDGILIPNATAATYVATQPGSYTAEPQAEAWTWQNPLPDGEDFNDVYFTSDLVGVAVGNYGKIVRTTDGGETWSVVPFAGKQSLKTVYFTSSSVGWIAGGDQALLKTTDAGLNWTAVNLGLPTYYYNFDDLFFTDSNHGWMIGNNSKVLRTSDGGTNWVESDPGLSNSNGLFFVDNSIGWLIGYNAGVNGIKKTTDGGATWGPLVNLGSNSSFNDIFFVNASIGWLTGYNSLFKTTDGGLSWVSMSGNFDSGTDFKHIFFTDASYGVLLTSKGFWNTPNGGEVWAPTSGGGADPTSLFMRSSSKAWITGRGGKILKGFQGSFSYEWKVTRGEGSFGGSGSRYSLDFVNANVGWASNGYGYLLKTNNGGKVWKSTSLQLVDNVDFIDESIGYAVVQKSYFGNDRGIYKSTNGGDSWNLQTDLVGGGYGKIQFVNSLTGWATNGISRIYRTTNGGGNWNYSDVGFSIYSLYFLDSNIGWVGGYNGQVAKTTDGGVSWTNVNTGASNNVANIYFKSSTDGWISGNPARKTTDGGITWSNFTVSGNERSFYSIDFTSPSSGIAINNYAYTSGGSPAFRTKDGGTTWTELLIPTGSGAGKIKFVDDSNAWIINYSGGIMHYAAPSSSCSSNALTLTNAPAAPTITASNAADVVCSGTPVTLTASGCAGTLQWSTGATTAAITVSPSTLASYSVFCTAGGCQSHANYSFGVVPQPTLSANSTNLCAGENVVLSSNLYGLSWKRDGQSLVNANSNSYIANQAGTYTVEDTLTLGSWVTYNPVPHNYTYRDLYFTDENTGYVVGDKGIIYKTTNAGGVWLPLESGTGDAFVAVQFTSTNTGFVLPSYSGYLLKTTNGGQSWSQVYHNFTGYKNSLFFIDSSNGWIAGNLGQILKTTDGGQTWISQNSGTNKNLGKIVFIDSNTGWAVGDNGIILKTTDGGQNWTAQNSGTSQSLTAIHFLNSAEGWVTGINGTFLKTTNGGATWTVIPMSSYSNSHFRSVQFLDSNQGFVVARSALLKTTDGGNTFTKYGQSIYGEFNDINFTSVNTGFAVGENGRIFKTTNSGIDWRPYADNYDLGRLDKLSFLDEGNGWAAADGGKSLVKTNDGGKSWSRATTQISLGTYEFINSIKFVTASMGWLCVNGSIFKTVDSGQTWNKQIEVSNTQLNNLFFLDGQKGWAVGLNFSNGNSGYILRTVDGGISWQGESIGTSYLNKVFFVSNSVGWIVGQNGILYKSTNGGANWSQQNSGTTNFLSTIYFQDANTGWIGGNEALLRTQDGGNNWVSAFFNYIGTKEIKIDNGVGWVIDYQAAYYTKNNGQTWATAKYLGSQQQVDAGVIFPSGKLYAAGEGRWMKFFPKPTTCNANSIVIKSAPNSPSVSSATIGSGQTATLTASGCSGTVNWYSAAGGGNSLSTGTSFTTPALTTTTTYYASCTAGGCTSATRGSGTVTVNGTASGEVFSIKTGSWHDPSTWDCNCIPNNMHTVEIKQNHTVTVSTADANLKDLKFSSGNLDFQNQKKLCFGCN